MSYTPIVRKKRDRSEGTDKKVRHPFYTLSRSFRLWNMYSPLAVLGVYSQMYFFMNFCNLNDLIELTHREHNVRDGLAGAQVWMLSEH